MLFICGWRCLVGMYESRELNVSHRLLDFVLRGMQLPAQLLKGGSCQAGLERPVISLAICVA